MGKSHVVHMCTYKCTCTCIYRNLSQIELVLSQAFICPSNTHWFSAWSDTSFFVSDLEVQSWHVNRGPTKGSSTSKCLQVQFALPTQPKAGCNNGRIMFCTNTTPTSPMFEAAGSGLVLQNSPVLRLSMLGTTLDRTSGVDPTTHSPKLRKW